MYHRLSSIIISILVQLEPKLNHKTSLNHRPPPITFLGLPGPQEAEIWSVGSFNTRYQGLDQVLRTRLGTRDQSMYYGLEAGIKLFQGEHVHLIVQMAGIYQEVHPYQPNVTKSCAKGTFSWRHFFKEMHESVCVLSMKGSVPRIC